MTRTDLLDRRRSPGTLRRVLLGRGLPLAVDALLLTALVFAAATFLWPFSRKADLLCQFMLQATIATALLTLLLAARRRPARALLAGAALACQLWLIQPGAALPASAAASGDTIRILTFNMYRDNPRKPDAVRWMLDLDPDILVLEEAQPEWQAALRELRARYPYRYDCLGFGGCDVVMLSKRPWTQGHTVADANAGFFFPIAETATAAGPLQIAGTHFNRPFTSDGSLKTQMAQAALIQANLAVGAMPTLLMGDFNSVRWGRVIRSIEAGTGLAALPGLEGTWPAYLPWPLRLPIDQVLVGPDVHVVRRQVLHAPGSDHRPVLVTIEGRLLPPSVPATTLTNQAAARTS
jgi:endonuclease/exonuclease/phosphatase (EEP) superfamily protein YafD